MTTPASPLLPSSLAQATECYIAHVLLGIPIRGLARAIGVHASTISRRIQRIEAERDDHLIDGGLSRYGAQTPLNKTDLSHQEICDMVTKTRTKSTPDETLVRKEAKRILRRLSETGAFLAVSPGMENAVVLKAAGQARPLRIGVLETRIAEAFALNEWISCTSKGRVLQYKITSVGRAALKRMLAEDDRARVARKDDAFTAQHSTLSDVVMKDAAGHDQKHRINLTESPLGALARRVGKAGDPFLSMEEVAAGEMLRADFERAQMGPRVAQNWERFLTVATPGSAAQGGNTLSGPVAAREAVGNALSALGPGLSDIALRCCCFLEGMETAEKRLGWSARSGKVVLKIALGRLATHYGSRMPG